MRFRGSVEATAVVLGAVLLAWVFTYPYIVHFNDAGRLDTNDGRWSIWVVSWVAHALTTDPSQLFRANIFYPHPNALAFSEGNIVEGVIGAPIWALTKNPYTTHNFVFLFAFAQSFVATYYLVRHLTGDRRAAVVAGILYAFCPFAFARQAHIQLLMVGFLPWAMLAWHRFMDRISIARAIELGLVLAATGLACAYYGIFAGGMIAFASIWFAITRQRWKDPKYWSLVAVAAAVCIGAIAAVLPALHADAGSDRVRAILERPVFRQRRRLADLVGVGASLVGGYLYAAQRSAVPRHSRDRPRDWGRVVLRGFDVLRTFTTTADRRTTVNDVERSRPRVVSTSASRSSPSG